MDDLTEDHLYEYHQEEWLCGHLVDLVDHLANEVFYVLFGNRKFLASFNHMMAGAFQHQFEDEPVASAVEHLKRPGVLKRVNIPAWARRAVFFRDRGMCATCQSDLSGLVSSQPDSQFDHIIPLARGGLNDVTNLQLLCESCNNKKSANLEPVSSIYESWY